jgi:hypothetical protein
MVTRAELLADAAVGYLVRKARRVGGRADKEVDRVQGKGMCALRELVGGAPPEYGALALLEERSHGGAKTERTVRRSAHAIAEGAESDGGFAERLEALVAELQRQEGTSGVGGTNVAASGRRSIAVGGDASAWIHRLDFSVIVFGCP